MCPACGSTVLGPVRPRALATCRFCLTCSADSPTMVSRAAPALEKRRATRAEAAATKRAKARERAKARAEREAHNKAQTLEARRWRVGFDRYAMLARLTLVDGQGYSLETIEPWTAAHCTKRGVEDPAWTAALAFQFFAEQTGTGAISPGLDAAEIAYGVTPDGPCRQTTIARRLYNPLRARFAELGPLHRAVSIAAATMRVSAHEERWQIMRRWHEVGQALDVLAERDARIDDDPIPDFPSLRKAASGLEPATPLWPEFLIPCPPALLSLEETGTQGNVPRGTPSPPAHPNCRTTVTTDMLITKGADVVIGASVAFDAEGRVIPAGPGDQIIGIVIDPGAHAGAAVIRLSSAAPVTFAHGATPH